MGKVLSMGLLVTYCALLILQDENVIKFFLTQCLLFIVGGYWSQRSTRPSRPRWSKG